MTVVVDLVSGVRVRFQVQGDASEEEIEKAARTHAGSAADDRVVAITIDEDAVGNENSGSAVVEFIRGSAAGTKQLAPSSAQGFAPGPPTTTSTSVGWKRTPTPAEKPESQVRAEIEALRVQQAELEASKFAGRDVDEADDEIRALEARKNELKALLPRKRFLYIF